MNQLKTIDEIEKQTKVGHTTISKYLKKYDIDKISVRERNIRRKSDIKLSSNEQDVILGGLLGDGCIFIDKQSYNNAMFMYSSTSKQHTEFIYSYLRNLCSDKGIRETHQKNRSHNLYNFNTRKIPILAKIWAEWYEQQKDGKYSKRNIPSDLKLNQLICLIWYIGDGGLRTRKKGINFPQQALSLATNNFKKEYIEDILLPQLSEFDAYLEATSNEGQYLITIPRRKISDFLSYIGDCPFDDYRYKWDIMPYVRNKANDEEIIKLYNNGFTYTQMENMTGCGRTTLITHIRKLKENGILQGRVP